MLGQEQTKYLNKFYMPSHCLFMIIRQGLSHTSHLKTYIKEERIANMLFKLEKIKAQWTEKV